MEGIARVLEHFGLFEFQLEDWRINVHGCPQVSKGIVLAESVAADDHIGRFVKIAHGAALAKEFGIEIDCKIFAGMQPGTFDKQRQSHRCCSTREHRAANDNRVEAPLLFQRMADFRKDRPQRIEFDIPVSPRRCSYSHEGNVRTADASLPGGVAGFKT